MKHACERTLETVKVLNIYKAVLLHPPNQWSIKSEDAKMPRRHVVTYFVSSLGGRGMVSAVPCWLSLSPKALNRNVIPPGFVP